MTTPFVWYDIEEDQIGLSGDLDTCFLNLLPGVNWERFELLGEL